MLNLRSVIGGMLAGLMLLTCVDVAHADRRHRRRNWRRNHVVVAPARTVVTQSVVGAPVVYQTYTTYDPYYRSGYGHYDRGGYRYYRGRNNNVMGRVLTRAVARSLR